MSANVYWTRQAREDLRAIRDFIARDAPKTASAYIRRLRESVHRLRRFPYSGQVVPEIGREVIQGNFRILYRVSDSRIDILTVYRGVHLSDEPDIDNWTIRQHGVAAQRSHRMVNDPQPRDHFP